MGDKWKAYCPTKQDSIEQMWEEEKNQKTKIGPFSFTLPGVVTNLVNY